MAPLGESRGRFVRGSPAFSQAVGPRFPEVLLSACEERLVVLPESWQLNCMRSAGEAVPVCRPAK